MKQTVKNIFIILRHPEKVKLCLLAVGDICISLLDILFLVALLYVVNFYTQPIQTSHTYKYTYFPLVFDEHPVLLITIFFLLFTLKNIAGFIVSKMQYRFVYAVASRISRQNLGQYLDGGFHDYINIDSSVANRKISQQPIEFAHYVLNGAQQVFSQTVLVVITIVAVLLFNPLFFPLLLLILGPPVFWVAFLMKRRLAAASLHGKKTSEQAMQHLQEALTGFVESNTYGKNDFFISRYHHLQTQLNHYLSERLIIQNLPPRLIEAFAVFGLLLLVIINFFTTESHSIPLVTTGALMVAAYKIIPGIVKITNTIGQVKTYAFAAADLAAVAHSAIKKQYQYKRIESIVFDKVCFTYPNKNVLKALSFNLQQGDFAVVSGASGSGKTTVVNLLLGFLSAGAGNIYINDSDAEAVNPQRYWPAIAYVKQQIFLLHASVVENITLQKGNYDKDKIARIIAITGIDTFIQSLPHGLQTIITENGKNMSGGQRQRICFARALYRNFDLLILDEPFNELDELSELQMTCELKKIASAGKMVLLITHNTAAISLCNKKILLDA